MQHVLIVEDSKAFASILSAKITKEQGLEVTVVHTLAEAREQIAGDGHKRFFMALTDLNLPDAPNGEVVDHLLKKEVPVVVLTGMLDDATKERIGAKYIVDYVLKNGVEEVNYAVEMVGRLYRNRSLKVLAVEDSKLYRDAMTDLLHNQLFQVEEAADGAQALEMVKADPEIKMVLTDYHMPVMDGLVLTQELRKIRSKEELAILGVSGVEEESLSARFIKNGANDFLKKPFSMEEFYCRVNNTVRTVEAAVRVPAPSPALPKGLQNRRSFFASAAKTLEDGTSATLGVAVLDRFDRLADPEKAVARVGLFLSKAANQRGIAARIGVCEFAVLLPGVALPEGEAFFRFLVQNVEKMEGVGATLSAGVAEGSGLEPLLLEADRQVEAAIAAGGNRVFPEG